MLHLLLALAPVQFSASVRSALQGHATQFVALTGNNTRAQMITGATKSLRPPLSAHAVAMDVMPGTILLVLVIRLTFPARHWAVVAKLYNLG